MHSANKGGHCEGCQCCAKLAILAAALEPFAEAATKYDDDTEEVCGGVGGFDLSDIRRAAEALGVVK